ncbi:MAG: hypothetical protein U0793_20065 [Gemmataceae bacterium]
MLAATLKELVAQLQQAELVPRPENEEWAAHVGRISVPGRVAAVTEDDYFYWLEVLPPKYQRGSLFAFAEGAEAFRLFWRKGGECFCRQLTWSETELFCSLAHISLPW